MKILNAFSLSMLTGNSELKVTKLGDLTQRSFGEALGGERAEWMIGHQSTCDLISEILGCGRIEAVRSNVSLSHGEEVLVLQYVGPRLPEGSTTLPEGAKIEVISVRTETLPANED